MNQLTLLVGALLAFNAKLSLQCLSTPARVIPPSQLHPPPPPPPTVSQCGHSIYYNTGETFPSGIVGGQDAKVNEFPWQVRLRIISGTANYLCGGVLINTKWVATAGHCGKAAVGTGTIVLVFGDFDRSVQDAGETATGITKVVFHPSYNTSGAVPNDYDIALIQIQGVVNYTGAIQPICLPKDCATSACQGGSTAWITGWGTVDSGSSSGTNILQKAWVPIISNSKCSVAYSYVMTPITDRMLCAGFDDGGVDTCRGDSGGPLVCNSAGYWELGGITSFGQGCGSAGYYGVYTKICTIIDWIKTTTAQMT